MGLSRLTLYEIAVNPDDIIVDAGGPSKDNGMFVGWITRGNSHNHKPLLNTNPIFKTAKLAKHFMQGVVDFAKKFTEEDLKNIREDPDNPLHFLILNQEELNTVQDIISASKGW